MLEVMRSDEELVAPILELFLELTGPDNPEEPFSLPFEEGITEAVRSWALNNVPMDTRYHMD